MRVRKNAKSLSAGEKKQLIAAVLQLKKQGRYDQYVRWHHHAMHPAVLPYEPPSSLYRNQAHRGPSFLPWHRAFLLAVENDLAAIDPSITLPYWDWTEDAKLPDPATSEIWRDDFLGGNGDPEDDWRVATGPFAYKTGNWPIPDDLDGPALRRRFGAVVDSLPTEEDLGLARSEVLYDTPNYDSTPFTVGFRNRLEGWITQRGDNRVKTTGSQLHNRVHLWVGGSMVLMTSPNDPVFFLHHAFVDKIWADWQRLQMERLPEDAPHYAPMEAGPPGHNFKDKLHPFEQTIEEMMDIRALGYEYEEKEEVRVAAKAAAIRKPIPFSPFMADWEG